MATLPIHLEVEDIAVGPVLIALRKMPGVISFKLVFDQLPAAAARNSAGANIQEQITAHLIKLAGASTSVADTASALGLSRSSVSSGLNQLRAKSIVKGLGGRQWGLTDKAQRELLSKPQASSIARGRSGRATPGSGWRLLRACLDNGPAKRAVISQYLSTHGMSSKGCEGVLSRAARDKLIKRAADGSYDLTEKGRQAEG